MFDFSLAASDPTNPNSTIATPDQIAMRQALATSLLKGGNDYSPVASPWQGAARLAEALTGAYLTKQNIGAQNTGRADATASMANLLGVDTGNLNLPSTPGQTTPGLAAADAKQDATQDAGDSSPLASALMANASQPATGPTAGGAPPVPPANIPNAGGYAEPTTPNVNTAGLNPAFADRVQDLQQDARDAGIPSTMISGARSVQLQAQLYANYQAHRANQALPYPKVGTGGLAAPPGQSYHNFGNAADVLTDNPGQQGALTAMAAEPWRGIYPGANFGDYDHYQIAGPINSGSPGQPVQAAIPNGPAPLAGSLAAYAALRNAGQPTPVSAYAGASGQAPAAAAISGQNAPPVPMPPPRPPDLGAPAPVPAPAMTQQLADALRGSSTIPGGVTPGIANMPGAASMVGALPQPAPGLTPQQQLAAAMAARAPQGGGMIPPASAAGAPPNPALGQAAALSAPSAPPPAPPAAPPQPGPWSLDTATAPGPMPPAMAANAAPATPSAPSTGAAPSGAAATAPLSAPTAAPAQGAPGGIDRAALLRLLSNPWASPGEQQIASALLQSQMPMPPTWGVTGKGADGSETYGWIHPRGPNGPYVTDANGKPVEPGQGAYNIGSSPGSPASTGAPAADTGPAQSTVNGAKIPDLPAIGATPEGLAWLHATEAQGGNQAMVARKALAIINGQAQLPDGGGMGPTKPFDIAVNDAVFKAAPGYNANLAASRAKAITEFQDKSSLTSRGGLVQNMNTAIGHLADLSDLSEKLPTDSNSELPINKGVNALKGFTSAGPNAATLSAYNTAKNVVSQEVTKFYEGGTGTEADRDALIKNLDPDAAPSARRAAIASISKLIQTKGTEIQRDWHQAVGAPDGQQYDYPIYGHEALSGMASIAQRADPTFTGAAPRPSAPPAGFVSKGYRFRGGDPSQQSNWEAVQ